MALDITELSRDEKLELLDRLWESLGQDLGALPMTSSQREELDRRLDELEDEGPTGALVGRDRRPGPSALAVKHVYRPVAAAFAQPEPCIMEEAPLREVVTGQADVVASMTI